MLGTLPKQIRLLSLLAVRFAYVLALSEAGESIIVEPSLSDSSANMLSMRRPQKVYKKILYFFYRYVIMSLGIRKIH